MTERSLTRLWPLDGPTTVATGFLVTFWFGVLVGMLGQLWAGGGR